MLKRAQRARPESSVCEVSIDYRARAQSTIEQRPD
jgi:hypothetical protein